MLLIQQFQYEKLALGSLRQWTDALCAHLRQHFPAELGALGVHALRRRVVLAMRRARLYGLNSPRDYGRYLNLAVVYGWDFDLQDQHAWMRAMLQDPMVSDPHQRLGRLIARCLYRHQVEQHNHELRERHASPCPSLPANRSHDG